jgi:hypothetical protein
VTPNGAGVRRLVVDGLICVPSVVISYFSVSGFFHSMFWFFGVHAGSESCFLPILWQAFIMVSLELCALIGGWWTRGLSCAVLVVVGLVDGYSGVTGYFHAASREALVVSQGFLEVAAGVLNVAFEDGGHDYELVVVLLWGVAFLGVMAISTNRRQSIARAVAVGIERLDLLSRRDLTTALHFGLDCLPENVSDFSVGWRVQCLRAASFRWNPRKAVIAQLKSLIPAEPDTAFDRFALADVDRLENLLCRDPLPDLAQKMMVDVDGRLGQLETIEVSVIRDVAQESAFQSGECIAAMHRALHEAAATLLLSFPNSPSVLRLAAMLRAIDNASGRVARSLADDIEKRLIDYASYSFVRALPPRWECVEVGELPAGAPSAGRRFSGRLLPRLRGNEVVTRERQLGPGALMVASVWLVGLAAMVFFLLSFITQRSAVVERRACADFVSQFVDVVGLFGAAGMARAKSLYDGSEAGYPAELMSAVDRLSQVWFENTRDSSAFASSFAWWENSAVGPRETGPAILHFDLCRMLGRAITLFSEAGDRHQAMQMLLELRPCEWGVDNVSRSDEEFRRGAPRRELKTLFLCATPVFIAASIVIATAIATYLNLLTTAAIYPAARTRESRSALMDYACAEFPGFGRVIGSLVTGLVTVLALTVSLCCVLPWLGGGEDLGELWIASRRMVNAARFTGAIWASAAGFETGNLDAALLELSQLDVGRGMAVVAQEIARVVMDSMPMLGLTGVTVFNEEKAIAVYEGSARVISLLRGFSVSEAVRMRTGIARQLEDGISVIMLWMVAGFGATAYMFYSAMRASDAIEALRVRGSLLGDAGHAIERSLSEHRNNILDLVSLPCVMVDQRDFVLQCNSAWLSHIGKGSDRVIGLPLEGDDTLLETVAIEGTTNSIVYLRESSQEAAQKTRLTLLDRQLLELRSVNTPRRFVTASAGVYSCSFAVALQIVMFPMRAETGHEAEWNPELWSRDCGVFEAWLNAQVGGMDARGDVDVLQADSRELTVLFGVNDVLGPQALVLSAVELALQILRVTTETVWRSGRVVVCQTVACSTTLDFHFEKRDVIRLEILGEAMDKSMALRQLCRDRAVVLCEDTATFLAELRFPLPLRGEGHGFVFSTGERR